MRLPRRFAFRNDSPYMNRVLPLIVAGELIRSDKRKGGNGMLKKLSIFIALIILSAGIAACEKEGPAEKAGEKVDEAIEQAGDKIEEAGDKIEKKTD